MRIKSGMKFAGIACLAAAAAVLTFFTVVDVSKAQPGYPFNPSFSVTVDDEIANLGNFTGGDDECIVGAPCSARYDILFPDMTDTPGSMFVFYPAALNVSPDAAVADGAKTGHAEALIEIDIGVGDCTIEAGQVPVPLSGDFVDATTGPVTDVPTPEGALGNVNSWSSILSGVVAQVRVALGDPTIAMVRRDLAIFVLPGPTYVPVNLLTMQGMGVGTLMVPVLGNPAAPPGPPYTCTTYDFHLKYFGQTPDTDPVDPRVDVQTCEAAGTHMWAFMATAKNNPTYPPAWRSDTGKCSVPQPAMLKEPAVANLWLMAAGCINEVEGKGCLAIEKSVVGAWDEDSPNDSDASREGVGAWEEQKKFDHKIVSLEPIPDNAWLTSTGRVANCNVTVITENWILEGCETQGAANGPQGSGLIEKILVHPVLDDLKLRMRPTKDNGIVTDLIDENCELADIYGEPDILGALPGGLLPVCSDAAITVRMLEGDLNLDCVVDVQDDQAVAYRYGAFFGLELYDPWFDLEPKYADFDIDIKDLQFVYGRNGSTCQVPIPDQPPAEPPQN